MTKRLTYSDVDAALRRLRTFDPDEVPDDLLPAFVTNLSRLKAKAKERQKALARRAHAEGVEPREDGSMGIPAEVMARIQPAVDQMETSVTLRTVDAKVILSLAGDEEPLDALADWHWMLREGA